MSGATATIGGPLDLFLTAYDPSDLPGGSIDPLGFERGYLFLADKILPGLTNVAQQPRYFSVLCAGVMLSDIGESSSPRAQYEKRLQTLLRFERFWALANVLSSKAGNGELSAGGIRGVTYAEEKAYSLLAKKASRADANFRLLSRQVPYGVVGIYAAVAAGMRFLDRNTFVLTPDLGERIGHHFLAATDCPRALRKAIREDGDVALGTLRDWGARAHISGPFAQEERSCFREALTHDSVRARMAAMLEKNPFHSFDDTELQRMQRLRQVFADDAPNLDLWEATSAILAYEDCYQLPMLAFERLLWLCRKQQGGAVTSASMQSDSVIRIVCERLPTSTAKLVNVLDSAESQQFRSDLHRLDDTRRFLESASAACASNQSLADELLTRHSDVQRGKFDRGRRKMPWIEKVGGRIALTMTRVGGLHFEATTPEDIAPHPYRFSSADALIAAANHEER